MIVDNVNITRDSLKEAMQPIPTRLNNMSQEVLRKHGNKIIGQVQIMQTPLNPAIETAINVLSVGKFQKLKEEAKHKTLYHVGLLLTLMDGSRVVFEKNEVPEIHDYRPKSDTKEVSVNRNGERKTLMEFVVNTINYMGNAFWTYSALQNNCQAFAVSALKANQYGDQVIYNYVGQDMDGIRNKLNNSAYSFVPKIMNSITDTASRVSRLLGKGTSQKGGGIKNIILSQKEKDFIKKIKIPHGFIKIILNNDFKIV